MYAWLTGAPPSGSAKKKKKKSKPKFKRKPDGVLILTGKARYESTDAY